MAPRASRKRKRSSSTASSGEAEKASSKSNSKPAAKKPKPAAKKPKPAAKKPKPAAKKPKSAAQAPTGSLPYTSKAETSDKNQPTKSSERHKSEEDIERKGTNIEVPTDDAAANNDLTTDLKETPSKTTAKKEVRKGSARHSAAPSAPLTPGDPNKPSSFINIDSNEQQLAAYIGYNDVSKLRILAMTWPILNAVVAFDPIALNMNKKTAFRLIADSEATFRNVAYDEKWPLTADDNDVERQQKKGRHLACILIDLETDLQVMQDSDQEENSQRQKESAERYNEANRDRAEEIPPIKYPPQGCKPELFEVSPPFLGPYEGESRMERLNRVWSLLKYFRSCRASKGQWNQKFSPTAICSCISVDISHVPHWMRKQPDIQEVKVGEKTAAVNLADSLDPLDIQVDWIKDAAFDGKEDFDDALLTAKAKGLKIPSTNQQLAEDPRLSPSGEYFRDAIRRQFNCQKLGIDIRSLELSYRNQKSPNRTQEKDILHDLWDESKSIFSDPANMDMIIHVQFEAAGEPDNIYEAFEVPPAISGLFDVSSGDVKTNTKGLTEIRKAFDQSAQNEEPGDLPQCLDLAFSQGGSSAHDIGSAPKPKKFAGPNAESKQLAYYDGICVKDEDARRQWQRNVLNEVTMNGRVAGVKPDKPPKDVSMEVRNAVEDAQILGQHLAMAKGEDQNLKDDQAYYTMKTAFAGTNSRAGPEVDLCLELLDCIPDPGNANMFIPQLLRDGKITDRSFYAYQISGAVGVVLKLYGEVDVDKLLEVTNSTLHPRAQRIREAGAQLKHLRIHGCILADDVGFGKTIQCLLAGFFHTLQYDERDADGEVLCKPILLLVLPVVISQWLREIRGHWPYFITVVSYEDHDLKTEMALQSLSYTAMSEYPNLEAVPTNLRYIFEKKDKKALKTIIVSTYETHIKRTGKKKCKETEGLLLRLKPNGDPVWRIRPKKLFYWVSHHKAVYSLLICDESQKIRNYSTGIWSVLFVQGIRKTMLVSATPIFNSVRDMLAPVTLMWDMIRIELQAHCDQNPTISDWLASVAESSKSLMEEVAELPVTDPRRLAALDPRLIKESISSKHKIHLKVSAHSYLIQDILMIQRCLASLLPVKEGAPIPLKGLFKQMTRKTAIIERNADEEIEYEMFHREAAIEYVNEMMLKRDITPSKRMRFDNTGGFISATRSLRKLGIANFSTKLARLNLAMEKVDGNTHVMQLRRWREEGLEAEFIHELTRGPGEPKAKTARELIKYLCEGSPSCRAVFQEILATKALEKLDKQRYKHHQKLIVVESIPACAWYLEALCRAALIDARWMHAGLSIQARTELCDLFNDPHSSVRVLIMIYEVGAVGLNLHVACDRVLSIAIPKSEAHNAQAAGRVNRVTSEFNVTFTTRHTPNSHDQFRAARQTDKATVQLAANAREPRIRSFMVQLLNELQPQVDLCHKSKEGLELKAKLEERARINAATLATRQKDVINKNRLVKATTEVQKESKQLRTSSTQWSEGVPGKRTRRPVERFNPTAYHDTRGFLLAPEAREARRQAALRQKCEICYRMIKDVDQMVTCEKCFSLAHYKCFGEKEHPGDDFQCKACQAVRTITSKKDRSKVKSKSTCRPENMESDDADDFNDDDFNDDDYDDGDTDNESEDIGDESHEAGYDSEETGDESDATGDDIPSLEVAREKRIAGAEEDHFLKELALEELADEEQPDDETRHRLALLAIPPEKTWVDEDLEDENNLKTGLHLLYNKIQGKEELHFGKSIHIRYHSFPKDVVAILEKRRELDKEQKEKAKKTVV